MKIALIVIGVIVIAFVAIEVVGRIVARRARARFDGLPPDEQRKEQARLYKAHQMG